MARRMVDTEIWKKDWFLDLSIKQKLIVKFLYDNCDCAGIYEISYRTLKNCFNEEITKSDLEGIKQIKFISDNKIFIEDFIQFQYGISIEQLNPTKSNVHKGICKSLKKNGLLTLNEPLPNPCLRVLDKDKNKDIDNIDIKLYGEYNNVCLSKKQYGKLLAYSLNQDLLDNAINDFSISIETGKEERYKVDLPNAHYERIKSFINYRRKHPEKFKKESDLKNYDIYSEA
jgi:hypothetical protein